MLTFISFQMYEDRFLPMDILWMWLYTYLLRENSVPSVLAITVACLRARWSKQISPKLSPAWQFFKNCTHFLRYQTSPPWEHSKSPSSTKYIQSPKSPQRMTTFPGSAGSATILSMRKPCSCSSKSRKRKELEKQKRIIIWVRSYLIPALRKLIGLRPPIKV